MTRTAFAGLESLDSVLRQNGNFVSYSSVYKITVGFRLGRRRIPLWFGLARFRHAAAPPIFFGGEAKLDFRAFLAFVWGVVFVEVTRLTVRMPRIR
jgi:hypothetical protein